MQGIRNHSPTPILMVGDGRGSDTTTHPPSNHEEARVMQIEHCKNVGADEAFVFQPSNHWGLGRSVFYRADLCDWLRGLYGLGGDEWNEALIRVGVVAGLEPGEWVPPE